MQNTYYRLFKNTSTSSNVAIEEDVAHVIEGYIDGRWLEEDSSLLSSTYFFIRNSDSKIIMVKYVIKEC